jgi:LmbE family N-acetylglucosaminyl deacetylase
MTAEARDPRTLDAQRILVIAPHPDDESLGCGGLIAILAAIGRRFHFVFVTDGGASHRNSATWPRHRLSTEREREASEALELLGVGDHPRSFLRLTDAGMPAPGDDEHVAALARLTIIAQDFDPDLVLLPWRRDPHRDHRDSWTLTHRALVEADRHPATLEYAIWLDELGAPEDHPMDAEAERIIFAIDAAVPAKRAATLAHRSQATDMIGDDPEAFRLTSHTIDRLTGPRETYWRPL